MAFLCLPCVLRDPNQAHRCLTVHIRGFPRPFEVLLMPAQHVRYCVLPTQDPHYPCGLWPGQMQRFRRRACPERAWFSHFQSWTFCTPSRLCCCSQWPDLMCSCRPWISWEQILRCRPKVLGELAPFLLRRVQPAWAQYSCCQPSTRAVWGPLCYRKATAKSISRYPCRTTCMQARLHHQELCGWGHAFLPHANQDLTCNYPFRTM